MARRTVASVTSVGIVAPVLAFGGLPGDLRAAERGRSDLARPDTVAPAAEHAEPTEPGPAPVEEAASVASVTTDPAAVTRVVTALGLARSGEVTIADVRAAARLLDIGVGTPLDPQDVDAVAAAGREIFGEWVGAVPYVAALGIRTDGAVDGPELAAAAVALGLDAPPVDLDVLHSAYLQRARPAVVSLGVPVTGPVDEQDLRGAADVLGLELGDTVTPEEVDALVTDAEASDVPLASFAGVSTADLTLPSRHVRHVGFHQSSSGAELELDDLGLPLSTVLASRRRGTSLTSAVDVAVEPDTPVLAPVEGVVVEATDYVLYGRHDDQRLTIRPDAAPDVLVTLIHLEGLRLRPGQHVAAGDVVATRARQLPFPSQIDRTVGPGPHVHLSARASGPLTE